PSGRDLASHRYCNLFVEEAGRLLGDDSFGLHLAIETEPREFGGIFYVFAASGTAREAIKNLIRYMRIANSVETFSLEEANGQVAIEGRPKSGIEGFGRHIFEYGDAVFLAALRTLTGERITPLSIEFDHHRTSSVEEFERFFGCPVRFGANRHRMIFSEQSLEVPFRSADPYLLAFARAVCEEALRRRRTSSTPLRAQAEGVVAELLPKGRATVPNV
ncbi:AraC family transcriptional regulator, partial [Cupriavidus sp. 2MCAB6]|uniref:AraC family transcriptional regulator n=1 Tax=Cupriavidus sp. 2MCAB6 TaxID=3232981 RepID=UPI003F8F2868